MTPSPPRHDRARRPAVTDAADLDAIIACARREQDARRPGAAGRDGRRALALAPDDTEALHLLGVLALQAGRPQEAALLIAQAVALRPGAAAYLCNLGEAHRALGELNQALACQRLAIALDPTLAAAHLDQGLALQALGRPAEAAASYRQALALQPTLADAALDGADLPATAARIGAAVEERKACSVGAQQVGLPAPASSTEGGPVLHSPGSTANPRVAARPAKRGR